MRVVPHPRYGHMFEREDEGRWHPQYSFDDAYVTAQDVAAANHWMEHHPMSHFRESRFAALFLEGGRVGLSDTGVTTRTNRDDRHERQTEEVAYGGDWVGELRERLGIELGELTAAERERLFGAGAAGTEN